MGEEEEALLLGMGECVDELSETERTPPCWMGICLGAVAVCWFT